MSRLIFRVYSATPAKPFKGSSKEPFLAICFSIWNVHCGNPFLDILGFHFGSPFLDILGFHFGNYFLGILGFHFGNYFSGILGFHFRSPFLDILGFHFGNYFLDILGFHFRSPFLDILGFHFGNRNPVHMGNAVSGIHITIDREGLLSVWTWKKTSYRSPKCLRGSTNLVVHGQYSI